MSVLLTYFTFFFFGLLPLCSAQSRTYRRDGRIAVDASGVESPSAASGDADNEFVLKQLGDGSISKTQVGLPGDLLEAGQSTSVLVMGGQVIDDSWTIDACTAGAKKCRWVQKLVLAHFTQPVEQGGPRGPEDALSTHTSVQHREDCAVKCFRRTDCLSIHYANQSKTCSLFDEGCSRTSVQSSSASAGQGSTESSLGVCLSLSFF